MSDLSCPNCGAELDLMTVFGHAADNRALARLAAVSVPLGARVLQYVQLHQPLRQRLTARKKIKLLLELLPDLERAQVTHKGRDWAAPRTAWAEAIDQMLAMRDAGRLELPIKGHGYLYAVLAGMADRHEAAQEKEREQLARARAVAQRGQAQGVGEAFAGVQAGPAQAPANTPASDAPKPGTSPTVRAMRAEIERALGQRTNPPKSHVGAAQAANNPKEKAP